MALKLTPEDLAKLRDKQLANAIRKLGEGKTLTAREDALLAQAGVGSTAHARSGFAKTWDELAQRLGVSLRALKDWRAREDLADSLPRPRADGRHDVAAWAAFMVEHGLARADELQPLSSDQQPATSDAASQPKTIRDWKARLEELKCQRLELKIRADSGELTATADIEVALGQLLVGFRASLDHLPASAARWVRGLTDFHAIVARLQDECDALMQGLWRADYLGEILPGIIATVPAPEGVTHEAWANALTLSLTAALRAIGRLALPEGADDAQDKAISEAPAATPPEPAPGQTTAATLDAAAPGAVEPRGKGRVKKGARQKTAKPARRRKQPDEAQALAELPQKRKR